MFIYFIYFQQITRSFLSDFRFIYLFYLIPFSRYYHLFVNNNSLAI